MTAELGQSRDPIRLVPGDLAAVHRTVALWRSRADDAEESGARLRQLRTVPEWAGEAADAYERRVAAAASPWDAMASAFRMAQAALEDFASALEAARARAGDAVDLWDEAEALVATAAMATPGFPGADRQPLRSLEPRAEARAILADARRALDTAAQTAAAALRRALALPGLQAEEWVALLADRASAAHILDALAGADGPSLRVILRARPAVADVLAQAEPAAVAPWWAALDEAQQQALIRAAPAVIGNLGGVAYAARDEANRRWLRTQLADARAALAEAEKTPSYRELVGGYATASTVAEHLERARARVAGLESIEASLEAPEGKAPRFLMSLTADAPPLAAISIGDLDSADDITFAVPGMGTTTREMGDWTRATQNIAAMQDRVDSGRTHAVVSWVGYRTPPVPLVSGGFEVMKTTFAEAGAAKLSDALAAVSAVRPAAELNLVAHSYGTTTASLALTREGVHADAFVTLGSAGLPPAIDQATDLHAGGVFAGQAQDILVIDPAGGDGWAWTGRLSAAHPVDPTDPQFGAHEFGVDGGDGLRPVTDHSVSTPQGTGYLDLETESLLNVALATTKHGDGLSAYVNPPPTPFQRAVIEGTKHGYAY